MLRIGDYLKAVRHLHGLTVAEMARGLGVSPSLVRRWGKGTVLPTWRRVRAMTTLWGGDPHMLMLGAMLERFSRITGLSFEEAERLARERSRPGRRKAGRRRRQARDRRQLSLPIGR